MIVNGIYNWKLIEVRLASTGIIIWRACGKNVRIEQDSGVIYIYVDHMDGAFLTDSVKVEVRM